MIIDKRWCGVLLWEWRFRDAGICKREEGGKPFGGNKHEERWCEKGE